MKKSFAFLFALSTLISSSALAEGNNIICNEINGTHGASAKESSELNASEIRALPSAIRKQVSEAEYAIHYTLTVFRGEATPEVMEAVAAQNDVELDVFSLDGQVRLSTFLDELSADDISSSLLLDGNKLEMSCDRK